MAKAHAARSTQLEGGAAEQPRVQAIALRQTSERLHSGPMLGSVGGNRPEQVSAEREIVRRRTARLSPRPVGIAGAIRSRAAPPTPRAGGQSHRMNHRAPLCAPRNRGGRRAWRLGGGKPSEARRGWATTEPHAPRPGTDHKTIETETIKVDPAIDPRRATTERKLRKPPPEAASDVHATATKADATIVDAPERTAWGRFGVVALVCVGVVVLVIAWSRKGDDASNAAPTQTVTATGTATATATATATTTEAKPATPEVAATPAATQSAPPATPEKAPSTQARPAVKLKPALKPGGSAADPQVKPPSEAATAAPNPKPTAPAPKPSDPFGRVF